MASLSIVRGQSYAFSYTHYHGTATTQTIFPLTGCTLYFTVKKAGDTSLTDSTAIIKVDINSFTDPLNGQTNVELTPAQTSYVLGISPNFIPTTTNYVYDIWVREPDGRIYPMDSGTVKIILPDTNRKVT